MNDLDELLQHGLNQISDQARQADLHRGVAKTARSIHRRRIAVRATAGVIGLGLTLSVATALQNAFDDAGPVPPVNTTPTPSRSASTPWISSEDLADLTGFAPWNSSPFSGWTSSPHPEPETTVCGAAATPLLGDSTLVNSSAYLNNLGGTESVVPEMIAYTVVRYDTGTDALAAYQALDGRMQVCESLSGSAAAFQVLDGWTLPGWELVGLRQREQLVQRNCSDCVDRYRSTMILLWNQYLAVVSWVQADEWHGDRGSAAILDRSLLAEMTRQETGGAPLESDRSGILGPTGFAGVELDMTLVDAVATHELDLASVLHRWGSPCLSAHLAAHPNVTVWLSRRLGAVVAIDGGRAAATPEGLHLHASEAEFKRTYPDFRQDQAGDPLSATVPGNPDARYVAGLLQTGLDAGTGSYQVEDLMLMSSIQDDCVNRLLGTE